MKRRQFVLSLTAVPAMLIAETVSARCITRESYVVACSTCGGDGLEDSGARLGLPLEQWKNKNICRSCGGSGKSQINRCTSYSPPSTSSAYPK